MELNGTMSKKCLHILVTSLNPGERLLTTLESIFKQNTDSINVIIKDGGSKDGALEGLKEAGYFSNHTNVNIITAPDRSIYDGMNQAVDAMNEIIKAQNDDSIANYCIFMNCGDTFYDDTVVEKVLPYLEKYDQPHIIYGDQYNLIQKTVVSSAPQINDFALFRNVPCHQVCFYDSRLFLNRAYNIEYTVRADYEHFLYSYYKENAVCKHVETVICCYEGGGYSETKENRKKSALQHRKITDIYMPKQARKYRAVMICTLQPLRAKMAESPAFSKAYNLLKSKIYKGKK